MIDFDEHGLQETRFAEPLALTQHACQHATRWANVYGASSPTDLATVGSAFGLHPLVQEDILNNAQRQKLDAYEDYLYLVLHRYEIQGNALDLVQDQISLIIGRDYVLTFQERPSQTFEPIRQRLRSGHHSLRKGASICWPIRSSTRWSIVISASSNNSTITPRSSKTRFWAGLTLQRWKAFTS